MKSVLSSVHSHIKHHHRHYLFGIFGGFALFKVFLLLTGFTVMHYAVVTNAQLDSGCILTGQYYTGGYETGCIEVPETITGGYLIGCETIPGYWTGGTLNESGELVNQIWIEPEQTGCSLTGYTVISSYITGCFFTGGYWTGGTLLCDQGQTTGDEEYDNQGSITDYESYHICTSGDIVWLYPVSGSSVRDVFAISWNIPYCIVSGTMVLQLWDHNNQWISLAEIDSGVTTYSFDSKSLYSFQQSGLYHIIGTNISGYDYYFYTGHYTGHYSRFFTGYKLRLLTTAQSPIYETGPFTIDNQYPTLTGISLTSLTGVSSGYVHFSGTVTLAFTASEPLTGLMVTLGSGILPDTSVVSGLQYSFVRNMTHLYPQGPLVATIGFSDIAGNTGNTVFTSALMFDYIRPVLTGLNFHAYDSGLLLNVLSSEPAKIDFAYWNAVYAPVSGTSIQYLTSHQLDFHTIQRDVLYAFTLKAIDRADNATIITGDVLWDTSLGRIVSHFYESPVTLMDTIPFTGQVKTFIAMMREEIEKFNACKEQISYTPLDLKIRRHSFLLHMPDFKKSEVKMLVHAFTLFVLDKIKSHTIVSPSDMDVLAKKFDQFLVILKLLRDDDNECKQHLSTYYITQFQEALEEYNISFD